MRIVLTRRESASVVDGINLFVYNLADAFVKLGHEVFVVTAWNTDINDVKKLYKCDNYPEIISLSTFFNKDPNTFLTWSKTRNIWIKYGVNKISDINPDVVIFNGVVNLNINKKIKTIAISHDIENRKIWLVPFQLIYRYFLYHKFYKIVTTTNELQLKLSKQLLISKNKINVIPTCLNLNNYSHNKSFSNRENAILHVGTRMPDKNPYLTINAFRKLVNEIGTKLYITELYITGRITNRLEKFVNSIDYSVRKHIHLLGFVSSTKLIELLSSVKILSVPSIYDFPVASPTVLEGLASGTPIVCSNGISQDVIINGNEGFIVNDFNEEEFSKKYEILLFNENVWSKISQNAIKKAKLFSNIEVAKKYLSLINKN